MTSTALRTAPVLRVRPAMPSAAQKAIAPVVLLLGWAALSSSGLFAADTIPGPVPVAARVLDMATTATFWTDIASTMTGWALGLLYSTIIAVPSGILLGTSDFAYRSCRFVIEFLRSIPTLGIIPLVALIYGTTRQTELTVVVAACVWPILLQTMYGVRDVDGAALEAARSYRLSRFQVIRFVIVASATPFVATGFRIAAVMAMLLAIGIELLAAVPGIGKTLAQAQTNAQMVDVFALTLVTALMGVAVLYLFAAAERRLCRWHPSQRIPS